MFFDQSRRLIPIFYSFNVAQKRRVQEVDVSNNFTFSCHLSDPTILSTLTLHLRSFVLITYIWTNTEFIFFVKLDWWNLQWCPIVIHWALRLKFGKINIEIWDSVNKDITFFSQSLFRFLPAVVCQLYRSEWNKLLWKCPGDWKGLCTLTVKLTVLLWKPHRCFANNS